MKSLIKFSMLLTFVSCVGFTYGQMVVGGNQSKAMDMNTTPLGTISAFGLPEKTTTGSHYFFKDWKSGVIELKEGALPPFPLNFDTKSGVVEIKTEKGIKVVDLKRVVSVDIKDEGETRKFIGGQNINTGLSGVVEMLFKGDSLYLLKRHYLVIQKANYNAALDMGNNEDKLIVKSALFIKFDDKLIEMTGKKNSFLTNFENEETRKTIERYFEDHDISLRNENDVLELCKFMNENLLTKVSGS